MTTGDLRMLCSYNKNKTTLTDYIKIINSYIEVHIQINQLESMCFLLKFLYPFKAFNIYRVCK